MSRICIVLIYGPQNIIPAFSAVKYYSQLKKEKIKSVQTVVFTPGLDEEYINEFKPIINNFVKSEGYLPPIFIKKEDVQILFHPPKIMTDFLIRKFIKKYVGLKNVDEIYFGHNIVGPFTDFCIQAFNKSELIIYGDGYGYINNEVKANFFEESINFEKNGVERIFNRFSNLIKKNSKQKVSIAAILPSNLSENELMTTKLHIVSKDIVLSIISKFNDNFNDIEKYFHSINFQKKEQCYLLLISNYSDNGFISATNEITFYTQLVESIAKENSLVFIKPHPFSKKNHIEMICHSLKQNYQAQILPPEISKYPIEIFQNQFFHCEIIGFSSSIISLAYLFDSVKIHLFNKALIYEYFTEEYRENMIGVYEYYIKQIEKIKQWDMKSIFMNNE